MQCRLCGTVLVWHVGANRPSTAIRLTGFGRASTLQVHSAPGEFFPRARLEDRVNAAELKQEWQRGQPRARRFILDLPVRYRAVGEAEWHHARSQNISCSGILFRTPEVVETRTQVEVIFRLEVDVVEESSPEVYCTGEVVRRVAPSAGDPMPGLAVRIYDYQFPTDMPMGRA
ncbi:MAG TPA: PilZ domain-containing protein [Terriglobales bacterium]|nr:PilZ domain-containing protein [Terriglobales bacterium]